MQFQSNQRTSPIFEDSTTSQLYRHMKFLPQQQTTTLEQIYSGIPILEQYIAATRNNIHTHLPEITANTQENMNKSELNFLKNLNKTETLLQ